MDWATNPEFVNRYVRKQSVGVLQFGVPRTRIISFREPRPTTLRSRCEKREGQCALNTDISSLTLEWK